MSTVRILKNFTDNYCYIIEHSGAAVVVDPGEPQPVVQALRAGKLELKALLITHAHFDHCAGTQQLKDMCGCSVFGYDSEKLPLIDRCVAHGDSIEACGLPFTVLETPGHTRDHVCYYMADHEAFKGGAVFTGDTLFSGGCGRIAGGTAAELYDSLHRLAELPGNTKVYCGHEYSLANYMFAASVEPENDSVRKKLAEVRDAADAGTPTVPTTLNEELSLNIFLRTADDDLKKAIGMSDASAVDVFAELRRQKDVFA